MALTRLRLFRGDTLDKLIESFIGFTDLDIPPPPQPFMPQWATYQGDPTPVPAGGGTGLPWTALHGYSSGDLLNRADPVLPLFLADGMYAITIVGSLPGTAAQTFSSYTLDTSRFPGQARGGGLDPMDSCTLSAVFPARAGDTLRVIAQNEDNPNTHPMSINQALIVMLSDQWL